MIKLLLSTIFNLPYFVWFIYGLLNLISLLVMFWDKRAAINNERRVSEGKIFFWAIFFGALGVGLGMILFRHKIRNFYFIIAVPLAICQNLLTLVYLYFVTISYFPRLL